MWQNWQGPGGMMYGYDGGGWFWGMAIHGLLAALFVAAVVAAVIVLVRWLARDGHDRPTGHGSALDILSARYARGEVDRDEYLQKKKDLA